MCVCVCLDVQTWRPHEINPKNVQHQYILHSWLLEPLLRPVKEDDTVRQADRRKETQPHEKWPKPARIIRLDTACCRKPPLGSRGWNLVFQQHSIAIDWYVLTP